MNTRQAKALERDFGTLRGLMNQESLDKKKRLMLWKLLQNVARRAPDEYKAQWLPYLSGFEHHFLKPLATLTTPVHVERACGLVPCARFALRFHVTSRGHKRALSAFSSVPETTAITSLVVTGEVNRSILLQTFKAPLCTHLEHLDFEACGGDATPVAIANTSKLTRLTTLNLGHHKISVEGIKTLAQATTLPALTHLGLKYNVFGDQGVEMLAESSLLDGVTSLDLSYNELKTSGARALAESVHLGALRTLTLDVNTLGDDGTIALATASKMSALTHLTLTHNHIADRGATALSCSPLLCSLEHLWLDYNKIGAAGATALAHELRRAERIELGLSMNRIGVEGVRAMAQCASLHRLDLSGNEVNMEGIRALIEPPILGPWRELDLSHNEAIGDEGIKALLTSHRCDELESLSLYKVGMSDAGARLIARSPRLARLKVLQVGGNGLSQKAIKSLTSSHHLTSLDSFYCVN